MSGISPSSGLRCSKGNQLATYQLTNSSLYAAQRYGEEKHETKPLKQLKLEVQLTIFIKLQLNKKTD